MTDCSAWPLYPAQQNKSPLVVGPTLCKGILLTLCCSRACHSYSHLSCLIKVFFTIKPNSLLEEISDTYCLLDYVIFWRYFSTSSKLYPGQLLASPPVNRTLVPRKENWVVQSSLSNIPPITIKNSFSGLAYICFTKKSGFYF